VFGVSGQELIIIALIALVLLGPQRIPEVARGLARAYRELTRVRRQVDSTLGELKTELKLDELDEAVRPPSGKRVPLDQLHAIEPDRGADTASGQATRPAPLNVAPEVDYLGK
jgi:sec-independent protein translocase protein TatB